MGTHAVLVVGAIAQALPHVLRDPALEVLLRELACVGVLHLQVVPLDGGTAVGGRRPGHGEAGVPARRRRRAGSLRAHIGPRRRRGGRGFGLPHLVDGDHLEGVLHIVGQPRDGARGRGAVLRYSGAGGRGHAVTGDRGTVVVTSGEVEVHHPVTHLGDAGRQRRIRLPAHSHLDLPGDITVGVLGVVAHGVDDGEDAVEVGGRGDHHVLTLDRDLSGAAGGDGVGDRPVATRERVGVVGEHRYRVRGPGIDHGGVQHGRQQGPTGPAHGDLDGGLDRIVRAVGDGDRHRDDGSLRRLRSGLRRHRGAVQPDRHLRVLGVRAEGEGQFIVLRVRRGGGQVHRGLRAALLHLHQCTLQGGGQVLVLGGHLDRDREGRGCGHRIPHLAVGDLHGDRVRTREVLCCSVQEGGLVLDQLGAVGAPGDDQIRVGHPRRLGARPNPDVLRIGEVDGRLAAGLDLDGLPHPHRCLLGAARHPDVPVGGAIVRVLDLIAVPLLLILRGDTDDAALDDLHALGAALEGDGEVGRAAIGVGVVGQHVHLDRLGLRVQHVGR